MTQDNKIWHKPDAEPDYEKAIVFVYKDGTAYVHQKSELHDGSPLRPLNDQTTKWAYLDALIASSKALDVAIDALKRLRDVPDEDNDQWFNYCCPRCVLQEINEIMKGGK